ncbi:uncharacterized protein HMPREF1120_00231 [Exophiala dermatitidis NIH/UT8656]|uniref:Uncharacterized protein n=1 Tax=Exophiala dermatitidis (strain ATCC 34100 / CBS 525.76 / NIH/UT8656) TaxID=858893 RepID=H6BM73_EXODN|nr:uncharacterized protein HMPREF1120_00231 [Exophiala dermatitidis NIH/UT8656]EHY52008.1 hypothetical protein HMPREF1120_00231 [Exophiala dermatitidis NIH/UT8656]
MHVSRKSMEQYCNSNSGAAVVGRQSCFKFWCRPTPAPTLNMQHFVLAGVCIVTQAGGKHCVARGAKHPPQATFHSFDQPWPSEGSKSQLCTTPKQASATANSAAAGEAKVCLLLTGRSRHSTLASGCGDALLSAVATTVHHWIEATRKRSGGELKGVR